MDSNNNTFQSFTDKWHKNKRLAFANTLNENSDIFKWILNRNGFNNAEDFRNYISSKTRILDAGCGNGRVSALLRTYSDPVATSIVCIDFTATDVAKENLKDYSNIIVKEKDLLSDMDDLGKFDFIYCQEVLHHTGNAEEAFRNLCGLLDKKGEIAIYVYKKKAPVREFVDDYISTKISGMDYNEAMEHCRQITEFSKVLVEQKIKIKTPRIDLLEIEEGEYDLQRFIYYFFMKCFWNGEFTFEENAVLNLDWYHPQNCTRHTPEEVREWFKENNLIINHEFIDPYGITIRGIRS
jgi:SAM-dependent methyltransferase